MTLSFIRAFALSICLSVSVAASDTVWVSFDGHAAAGVRAALADEGITLRLDRYTSGDTVAVARVRRDDLPRLTRIFHEDYHRCGGYRVHGSSLEAHTAKTEVSLHGKTTAVRKAVVYTLDNAEVVGAMTVQVDADEIADTITHLENFGNRFYNTQQGVDSANWLRGYWDDLTQNVPGAATELFSHSFLQPSVILTIPGSTFPDEVVVLGAHLDSTAGTTDSPGADDDASGIACLTEVVRILAASGFQPQRTLKFMGYAGEEHGLLGSGDIADAYSAASVNVVGVLQLDMTNYNGSTEDIWLISDYTNGPQNAFLGQLIDTYLPDLTRSSTACGYACSDHASWHFAGFPASFPFEARFGSYNPFIHTANDTLSVSGDALHAAKFSRVALTYVAELAKGSLGAVEPVTYDTRVAVPHLMDMKAAQGPCGAQPCPRDLNNDGTVDEADLGLLQANWGLDTCLGFTQGTVCTD